MAQIRSDDPDRQKMRPRRSPSDSSTPDAGSPNRDPGRLGSSRDSRGPDTGESMEREVRPPRGVTRHD
jgi:hypothetical protein